MAKTCQFTSGVTTITIKAPVYPEREGYVYPMVVGRTMGGGFRVVDLGDGTEHRDMTLAFRNLSRTDWEALRDFIITTVSWSKLAFSYKDPYATTHTDMHYLGGLPEAVSSRGDRWACDLRIAKDMTA